MTTNLIARNKKRIYTTERSGSASRGDRRRPHGPRRALAAARQSAARRRRRRLEQVWNSLLITRGLLRWLVRLVGGVDRSCSSLAALLVMVAGGHSPSRSDAVRALAAVSTTWAITG